MGSRRLHGWRKLAGAFRGAPNDPQFYGDVEIDAGTPLEHLHQVRSRTGVRITVTHAYAPLASYYRVPLLVLVGAVTHKPGGGVRAGGGPADPDADGDLRPPLRGRSPGARFAAAVKDALTDPEQLGRPPYDRSPRPTGARHVGVRRGYRGRDVTPPQPRK